MFSAAYITPKIYTELFWYSLALHIYRAWGSDPQWYQNSTRLDKAIGALCRIWSISAWCDGDDIKVILKPLVSQFTEHPYREEISVATTATIGRIFALVDRIFALVDNKILHAYIKFIQELYVEFGHTWSKLVPHNKGHSSSTSVLLKQQIRQTMTPGGIELKLITKK